MGNKLHKSLAEGDNHGVVSYTFATEEIKAAQTIFKLEDVNKLARVVQGEKLYRLTSHNPVIWLEVGSKPILQCVMSQPGALESMAGTAKWFPPDAVKLVDIRAVVGLAPTSPITITVKKNGTAIQTLTIASGQVESSRIENTTALSLTDYLTADVDATSGENLSVFIRYQ